MRRSPVALVALAAVALTAAACGGSSKSSSPTSTAGAADGSAAAGGSAAAILKSIDRTVGASPQKITLDVNVDIKGTPANAQLAVFTRKPIHLTLDGIVDNSAGKSGGDVNVNVALGDTPIAAEIRYGGGKSWVQLDGKWYEVPASALSSATGTSVPSGASASSFDVNKVIAAMGDMSKVFTNATVSSDEVEGIDSDKVSADIDFAELGKVSTKGAEAMGTGTTVTSGEIDSVMAQVQKIVKTAHVELWIGKSDHKVHRTTMTADAVMDDATKSSSGIEAVTFKLDTTTIDSDAPDVSAPSSVGTPEEFQTAAIGLLGKVMGGAAAG
jgi:hypothetical protein